MPVLILKGMSWWAICCVALFTFKIFFVYNQLDDDVYWAISDCILHEYNKKLFFPFEIIDSPNTPLFEIDPDMQNYMDMNYTENIRCNCFLKMLFMAKMMKIDKSNLSMFHLNVKSLPE